MARTMSHVFRRELANCIFKDFIASSFARQTCIRCKTTVVSMKEKPLVVDEPIISDSYSQNSHPKDPLDLSFNNTKEAYKSKKTSELIRAFLVLKLTSYDFLVNNHQKVRHLIGFCSLNLIIFDSTAHQTVA